jgi:Mannosyltransferase (PIG-V)
MLEIIHINSAHWHGLRRLLVLFCIWKFVLFSIVASAPGPGYDTSSTLLADIASPATSTAKVQECPTDFHRVLNFVRWDAIYFSQIAQRGYLFEQEWAFGAGFPILVGLLQRGMSDPTESSILFNAAQADSAIDYLTILPPQLLSEWPCQLFVTFFRYFLYTGWRTQFSPRLLRSNHLSPLPPSMSSAPLEPFLFLRALKHSSLFFTF